MAIGTSVPTGLDAKTVISLPQQTVIRVLQRAQQVAAAQALDDGLSIELSWLIEEVQDRD